MLHSLNEKILNDLIVYREKLNLSGPLLVDSSKDFLNNIKKQKSIMYIGQETNGWVNSNDLNEYEYTYRNFLYNCTYLKPFWSFLKNVCQKNNFKFDNILWANSLICGKKDQSGTPNINDFIRQLSLEYLIELYKYFRPQMLIIVSGPNSPYYEIVTEFLKILNSELSGLKPTRDNYCLCDNDKNIHYTYHPNYLNRSNLFDKVSLELAYKYKNI